MSFLFDGYKESEIFCFKNSLLVSYVNLLEYLKVELRT